MSDDIFLDKETSIKFGSISFPQYSDWRVTIGGTIVITPVKGKEPNRFHMFMQWLVLGFEWEKVK